jgi:molybdopterin synthase catalytic subunit
MRYRVLLFAQLAEALGTTELELVAEDGATAGDALRTLSARHEPIAALAGRLALAVDDRYASPDTPLRDGCTIALIPPVSGG